jgi:hypothetical protein
VNKLTPIFVVERIEPCLSFWVDRLGFEKKVEVPAGDSVGFVILARGNVEIMYQSRESVLEDAPAVLEGRPALLFPNGTYIEVSEIRDVERRLAGWEIVLPKRTSAMAAVIRFYSLDSIAGIVDLAPQKESRLVLKRPVTPSSR